MTNRRITTALWSLALAATLSAGTVECDVSANAKPWEKTAAQELKAYLDKRVGDHRLTVGGEAPRFHVGDTAFAATKGLSGKGLKDEEWVVKSFGRDVVINGGGSHGALYALYHFLEDDCGLRFFSETEEEIPAASDLSFAKLDRRGKPFFYFRDIYVWHDTDSKHAPIAIKRRLNGYGAVKLPVELGGFAYHGREAFTHTMNYYISWEEYGKTHPEYFSLYKGKRVGGMHTGNHCISNPEVWKIFERCVFDDIEKSNAKAKAEGVPPPRFCELEINDTGICCECPACAKLVERYGWSGAYLREVNKIADKVKAKYPDRLVNFTAYLFTEPPPKGGVRCADNVGVNFNDTKGNWAAGWYEPTNDKSRKMMEEWAKYSDHLILNGFTVTFGSYCKGFPFANEFLFDDRFRFMAKHKFLGFFIEHEEHNGVADMHDLKFYMMTKLAENPYADQDAIIRDFLKNYLGPAAEDIYDARVRIARCRKENDGLVIWSPIPTFQFIHSSDQKFIEERFAAARAKVKGVERYERRLEKCWTGCRLLFEQRAKAVLAKDDAFVVRGGSFELGWGSDIDGEKGQNPDDHDPDRLLELPNKGPLKVDVADWLGNKSVFAVEKKIPLSGDFAAVDYGEVVFGEENGLWIKTGGHAVRAIVTPSGIAAGQKYRLSVEVRASKDAYAIRNVTLMPVYALRGKISEKEFRARAEGLPADTYWGGLGDISTKPADYLVYVPKQELWNEKKKPEEKGTGYNDHFQVLRDEKRKILYAFWTQASWESAGDHHVVFSKSADDGKTWTEPRTLAGNERRVNKDKILIADWQQPMLSKSGRLYCLWNRPDGPQGYQRALMGAYSDDGGETWSEPQRTWSSAHEPGFPPGWINWQRPIRVGADGKYMAACSLDYRVEFWQYENIDEDPDVKDIRVSVFARNKDSISVSRLAERSGYVQDGRPSAEEGSIVKLPDGRLFCLMRSTVGHPLWSQSRDGGKSWSDPKFLRDHDGGYAYLHCCSPCPIYDYGGCAAGSGKYFAFVHDKFDFSNTTTASQDRPGLYLIAGTFDPTAEQPIRFGRMKPFVGKPHGRGNSFYTSYTVFGEHHILWYPDGKYYLKGIEIGPEWME